MSVSVRKVAFFHPHFRDGGVERSITILGEGFRERGVSTETLTFGATSTIAGWGAAPTLTDLGVSRAVFSIVPLARHLRRSRPDFLIAFQSYGNVVAVVANLLAGRPTRVMVSERSAISQERGAFASVMGKGRVKNRMLLLMMRIFYRLADAVTANSADGAADLERVLGLAPGAVTVLYNPTFEPGILAKAREPVRHPFFSPQAPAADDEGRVPVVISAGRLSAEKDHATLIRAFAAVRAARPCRLVLVGEGAERPRLQELAAELGVASDVSLPGFDANPWKYIAASDVFALSSLWEGLPNALIEAVALDVPCVSTDCLSGPREILSGGRGGLLVPVRDVPALAAALRALLDDRARARALAEAARGGLSRFEARHAVEAYLTRMTKD